MIPGTDERLCVDCRAGDNSSVFHRDMLDNPDEFATAEKPWCFDHSHGPTEFYETEDEACAAQRAYRAAHGFDPETGDLVKRRVVVEVSGGVAEVTSCPDDVEVEIIDGRQP